LTKEVDNDYIAEVSTVGKTLHNADIARLMVDTGTEMQFETLVDILNRADRHRREKLQEGYSIQTGICHLSPRVLGNWVGAATAFDPAKHRRTLSITPTAEMRAALENVGVEVLGIREGGAFIGLVTDVATGLADGIITPGGQIIIAGDKIKIEPIGEPGIGVFLTNGVTEYPLAPLAVNRPKEIIAIVPPGLPDGTYSLYAATRYAGGNTLLKDIRRVSYNTPLIVAGKKSDEGSDDETEK
jgi:hypothetical protein